MTDTLSPVDIDTVAVVGTGVIGRSWARVFSRAGCTTKIFDRDPRRSAEAAGWIRNDLASDVEDGLLSEAEADAQASRVLVAGGLEQAVEGAAYVQENGPEDLDEKRAIFTRLDALSGPDAILASSTSGLDMTEIAAGLRGAPRCIVAHPVNPPHVIPVVEVLPGERTQPEVAERATAFLAHVGQTPVRLNRYVLGFLLNRMQAALLREAFHLVSEGIADVDAVDAVIRDGLGLRWALMGPFGVANTNADGGVREYFTRYRKAYLDDMNDLGPTPALDEDQIERVGYGTDRMVGAVDLAEVRRWRDRMILRLRGLKAADPFPSDGS